MEKKHKIVSDVILNKSNQDTTTSENSPPATRPPERSPSDSSISSCRSYLSHGDGSEHSLHPSPPPPIIYHPPDESVTSVNRSLRNELVPSKKAYAAAAPAAVVGHGFLGGAAEEGGGRGGVSTNATRRPKTTSSTTMRRRRSEGAVKKAALGFRVFGFVFCLISFSVMAADRRKGWALDSFDRYIEFRYCLTVNVIGFVYSALQGLNLAYQLSSGKLVSGSHLRYVFDFAFDQMLAYLLISSSSSAAIRADDWKSNWGKDDFPDMASASVAVSFMAFVALASSALISGYTLCTL